MKCQHDEVRCRSARAACCKTPHAPSGECRGPACPSSDVRSGPADQNTLSPSREGNACQHTHSANRHGSAGP
eukprot:2734197-Pyramimonas_sp.AAC.2